MDSDLPGSAAGGKPAIIVRVTRGGDANSAEQYQLTDLTPRTTVDDLMCRLQHVCQICPSEQAWTFGDERRTLDRHLSVLGQMTADCGGLDHTSSSSPVVHVAHKVDRTTADYETARRWNVLQVCEWLEQTGNEGLMPMFRKQNVDGPLLFALTSEVMEEIGIQTEVERVRLGEHIAMLREAQLVDVKAFVAATSTFQRFQAVTTCTLSSLRTLIETVCYEQARLYDQISYLDEDGDSICISSNLTLAAALKSCAASGACLKLRLANTAVPGKTQELKLNIKG